MRTCKDKAIRLSDLLLCFLLTENSDLMCCTGRLRYTCIRCTYILFLEKAVSDTTIEKSTVPGTQDCILHNVHVT